MTTPMRSAATTPAEIASRITSAWLMACPRRSSSRPLLTPCARTRPRHPEQETLREIDPERPHRREVRLALHAFGDHRAGHVVSHLADRGEDGAAGGVDAAAGHDVAIDLEVIRLTAEDHLVARLAAADVVESELDTQPAQGIDRPLAGRGEDRRKLDELDDQARR